MAKDFFHQRFRTALEKDGWTVTHDPLPLRLGNIGYEVDFGAERLMAAERAGAKIAVELKSFEGPSDVNEFHKAVGQFNDYFVALEVLEPDRVLYLAVPEETWNGFFQEALVQRAIQRVGAKIIVYQPTTETIVTWIN